LVVSGKAKIIERTLRNFQALFAYFFAGRGMRIVARG